MGRKAKNVDKEGYFQARLREQFNKHFKSQSELANMLGMSRQAVGGWLKGESVPDISALETMARHFGVSADYLLGLSDTATPDTSARAAAAYTGLSEEAVTRLHIGLDDFECDGIGLSEEEKNKNLAVASALIQSKAFRRIIHNLGSVADEAYFERILKILDERSSSSNPLDEDSDFCYASTEDRDFVITNLIHVFTKKSPYWKEIISTPLEEMDDEELANEVIRALLSAQEANELHQFHATKAFTDFIDQLVKGSRQKADRRFEPK